MAEKQPDLIPMVRDDPIHENGAVTAHVHPDSVAEFEKHGWRRSESGSESGKAKTKTKAKSQANENPS